MHINKTMLNVYTIKQFQRLVYLQVIKRTKGRREGGWGERHISPIVPLGCIRKFR